MLHPLVPRVLFLSHRYIYTNLPFTLCGQRIRVALCRALYTWNPLCKRTTYIRTFLPSSMQSKFFFFFISFKQAHVKCTLRFKFCRTANCLENRICHQPTPLIFPYYLFVLCICVYEKENNRL